MGKCIEFIGGIPTVKVLSTGESQRREKKLRNTYLQRGFHQWDLSVAFSLEGCCLWGEKEGRKGGKQE